MRTHNGRPVTCRLMELMDEGTLDPRAVADACLVYFSEDDVASMAHANELPVGEEEEEESSDDDEDD